VNRHSIESDPAPRPCLCEHSHIRMAVLSGPVRFVYNLPTRAASGWSHSGSAMMRAEGSHSWRELTRFHFSAQPKSFSSQHR